MAFQSENVSTYLNTSALRRQLSSPFWMLSSPVMLITSLTGLVPERVQLTVHTTKPTGTVPEPFHCDHIVRWSARSGTTGHSGTGLNTGNWNGSGTVPVSNLWCEHGLTVWKITSIYPARKKKGLIYKYVMNNL